MHSLTNAFVVAAGAYGTRSASLVAPTSPKTSVFQRATTPPTDTYFATTKAEIEFSDVESVSSGGYSTPSSRASSLEPEIYIRFESEAPIVKKIIREMNSMGFVHWEDTLEHRMRVFDLTSTTSLPSHLSSKAEPLPGVEPDETTATSTDSKRPADGDSSSSPMPALLYPNLYFPKVTRDEKATAATAETLNSTAGTVPPSTALYADNSNTFLMSLLERLKDPSFREGFDEFMKMARAAVEGGKRMEATIAQWEVERVERQAKADSARKAEADERVKMEMSRKAEEERRKVEEERGKVRLAEWETNDERRLEELRMRNLAITQTESARPTTGKARYAPKIDSRFGPLQSVRNKLAAAGELDMPPRPLAGQKREAPPKPHCEGECEVCATWVAAADDIPEIKRRKLEKFGCHKVAMERKWEEFAKEEVMEEYRVRKQERQRAAKETKRQ